jgi:hypothetical protein
MPLKLNRLACASNIQIFSGNVEKLPVGSLLFVGSPLNFKP